MSDRDIKQAYWTRVKWLTFTSVCALVLLSIALAIWMPSLNSHRFLRFPLGYFIAAQVFILACGFVIYGFFGAQARTDQAHNMTIQF